MVGKVNMEVHYQGQQAKLPLIVVEGDGPSLFGRDWLSAIHFDWNSINMVKRLASVLDKHQVLLDGGWTGYPKRLLGKDHC